MKNRIIFLFATFILTAQVIAQTPMDRRVDFIDKVAQKGLETLGVPGMAIAVIEGDNTLLSKGYGVRSMATGEAVTDSTLFAIASNSKAFTAAALAILVDRGSIKWDDKVRKYLPYFTLYSPYVSEEFTVRDLLCHRSGLDTFSGDLIWYGSEHSREQVIRRARFLEPSFGFREQYGYSNIMYLAAGEVVAKVSGMSWEEFVKTNILLPLGMQTTNSSVASYIHSSGRVSSEDWDNIASPHNEVKGQCIPIEYINWDNIGPAGSINSSVAELTNWMRLQLGKGSYRGREYWKEQRAWEMWENNMPKPVSKWQREQMPSRHFNGYGLGWELMEYRGCKIVSHGGGYDGMISKTVLIPEKNLGFVILTNSNNSLPSCLTFEILDGLLMEIDKKGKFKGEKKDWVGIFENFRKQDEEAARKAEEDRLNARVKSAEMSLALASYCGIYTSEMYGDVLVTLDDNPLTPYGGLKINFAPTPLFKGQLTHWHYDTFELTWSTQMMLPKGTATFVLNEDGKPIELKVVVDNPDFDFTELKLIRKP
ncbi:MAG: serine hydrolase [Flavobacteriales bacterium]|jgi:CubicO group peptidase (beta-lactamase class C family)